MNISNSTLHCFIMRHIVDRGYAPKIADIARQFHIPVEVAIESLRQLQDDHGVVLHPQSNEVWIMHPFSTAPTNFWIQSKTGSWWGNCAWCSLGAAALLDEDLTITTTLGAEATQCVVSIQGGVIQHESLYIHFPIPMMEAWDNVIFTCSTMLLFESESDIDEWCVRHGMKKGDVQPIHTIWEFSKVWYGNHLNPDWKKWTVDEAKAIFQQFGLVSDIWKMPESTSRF
jgi:hypothetical protein